MVHVWRAFLATKRQQKVPAFGIPQHRQHTYSSHRRWGPCYKIYWEETWPIVYIYILIIIDIYIGFPGPAIKCLRHPAFGMPHSKWQTYSSLCSNYPNQSSSKLFYEPHELQRSTQRLPRTWSLFSFIQITVRVWVMLRVRVFPCFSGSRATNQTVLH